MPVITKFPCYWELHQRSHTKPGGSWAAPANVYIPNILQKHPMELEQTSECALKKKEKEKILIMNCSLEFTEVFFHSFLREFCLKEPSGKCSAHIFLGVVGGGGNTTAC